MGIENFIQEALYKPNDYIAYHVGRELAELHPDKAVIQGYNWYSDVDSFNGALTTRQFLDPNVVVGVGPGLDMVAMFGAIMDADANFSVEQPIFPKMWKNADPSVVYTMSQSAPLFVPLNPNNSFKLFTE